MSSSDFFRKYQPLFEEKECAKDKDDKKAKAKKEEPKAEESKKPTNVKESGAEFFRRYSDIIAEAEDYDDDEDPDVTIADKEKGKDGKSQKDADKKLPPWLQKSMDKKDKSSEDKGAKKAKKEVDEGQVNEISDATVGSMLQKRRDNEKSANTAPHNDAGNSAAFAATGKRTKAVGSARTRSNRQGNSPYSDLPTAPVKTESRRSR